MTLELRVGIGPDDVTGSRRDAKVLVSPDHSNIATTYGLEEPDMSPAAHMSPEPAGRSVGRRSDVRTLGCLLCEMLNGSGPGS